MIHTSQKATGKVALAATLLLGLAACAQPGGPPAMTPTSSQMSMTPMSSAPAAMPAATGAQGGMGSMPGHNMSNMQGHNMGSMGGMNMQQMMQYCEQMRAQGQQGTLSPQMQQMQQMMQHCQAMNH